MGREIKFRAKRLDRDEWVYGNFVRIDDDYRIIEQEAHNNMVVDCQVVAETVGQFTGLHDKNGVEIYEGDICTHESLPGAKNGLEVVFENMGYQIKGKMLSDDIILCDNSNRYITVIGNVHEGIKQ